MVDRGVKMYKTIGIFAHVDAGKTTFAEQLLYLTNSIKNPGRVDHQNSFLDYHDIERQRGITVFSEQACFSYKESSFHLIDTPGHIDFSTEMERAMLIMDYAIVLISAVEGIQAHTQTIWNLLQSKGIPSFIFINKVDREGANVTKILEEIKSRLLVETLYIKKSDDINQMTDDFVECFAMCDEELMVQYFEQNYTPQDWLKSLIKLIRQQRIVPVMSGSALKNIGIEEFLDALNQLTETSYSAKGDFSGIIYKIRYDSKGEKLAYIKANSGSLKVRDPLLCNGSTQTEKVNQIRIYNGNQYQTVNFVEAGQLFAVSGLKQAKIGDTFGNYKDEARMKLIPTLQVAVINPSNLPPTEILTLFKKLEDEDPALSVIWDVKTQQVYIDIMGLIQLDVLKEGIKNRFGIEIDFGPCGVIYLETIESSVVGRGHYEPLKHYAEVHLRMEPGLSGSGITFDSECHIDQLPSSFQNLVQDYVLKKDLRGILTGSIVTDLKVTLLAGAAHEKHTSGGDFKEATYRALRQGLEKASNLLLEPYYQIEVEVELELMGRILMDIQKANGECELPIVQENRCLIKGKVPVATFMTYPIQFMSLTKGQGRINLTVLGYERCHNPNQIIESIGYDKESDRDFPSASIFCSKGSGFVVAWDEADLYMHCKS